MKGRRSYHRPRLSVSVRDQLLALIKEQYGVGSQLPSEAELAEKLQVSRVTLREALQALEEDGIVARRHGVGTFVKGGEPILVSRLDVNLGITDIICSNSMVPGASEHSLSVVFADPSTAAKLEISVGTPVIKLERVRTANERPVIFSTDVVPLRLVPDPAKLQTLGTSLYKFLEQECSVYVAYGLARVAPTRAGRAIAERLGVDPHALLLLIEQVDYSSDGKAVVYSREYHLRDAFQFAVLRRSPSVDSGDPSVDDKMNSLFRTIVSEEVSDA